MKINVRNFYGRLEEAMVGSLPSTNFIEEATGKRLSNDMRQLHDETMNDIEDLKVMLERLGVVVHGVSCESFDDELTLGKKFLTVGDNVYCTWHSDSVDSYHIPNLVNVGRTEKIMSNGDDRFYFSGNNILVAENQVIFGNEKDRNKIDAFKTHLGSVKINPFYHGETTGFVSSDLCLSYDSYEKTNKIYETKHHIGLDKYFKNYENNFVKLNNFVDQKTVRCLSFDTELERQSEARFFLSGYRIDLLEEYLLNMKGLFDHELFDCRFLVVDRNTIVSNTKNKELISECKKKGVEVIQTNWRHGIMFDTSIRDLVLPLRRNAG